VRLDLEDPLEVGLQPRDLRRPTGRDVDVLVEAVDVDLLGDVGDEAQADRVAAVVAQRLRLADRRAAAHADRLDPRCGRLARLDRLLLPDGVVAEPAGGAASVCAAGDVALPLFSSSPPPAASAIPPTRTIAAMASSTMRWRPVTAGQVNDEGRALGPPFVSDV
jgi:hypothetical protein